MKEVYKKLFEFRKLTGKIIKSTSNPFHKTKYADLNSVLEATDPALEEVGLLWIDRPTEMTLESDIIDVDSGEKITIICPILLSKQDMQSYGSGLTYGRRYNRLAALGLQTVDEDGNVASGTVFAKPRQIKDINELILKTKTDTPKFLQYFHVSAVKDLTEQAAIQAIKTLTLKLEKEAQDGTESN